MAAKHNLGSPIDGSESYLIDKMARIPFSLSWPGLIFLSLFLHFIYFDIFIHFIFFSRIILLIRLCHSLQYCSSAFSFVPPFLYLFSFILLFGVRPVHFDNFHQPFFFPVWSCDCSGFFVIPQFRHFSFNSLS